MECSSLTSSSQLASCNTPAYALEWPLPEPPWWCTAAPHVPSVWWSNTVWTCLCTKWSQLGVWFPLTWGTDKGRKQVRALSRRRIAEERDRLTASVSSVCINPSLSAITVTAFNRRLMIENNRRGYTTVLVDLAWIRMNHPRLFNI